MYKEPKALMSLSSLRHSWPIAIYALLAIISITSVVFIVFFSPQAQARHDIDEEATRSGYMLSSTTPDTMEEKWNKQGVEELISAPGTIITTTQDSVSRLDKDTGDEIWKYSRPGGKICDAAQAWGDVVVVYDMGKGCTDVTRFDAATGEYVNQASYATDQDNLKMVYSNEKLALVTPHSIRLLRDDLVVTSEFGQTVDHFDDTSYKNCDIYDATVSPEALIVSHKCNGSDTTHVTAVESEPEESTDPETIVDVDTHSNDPVTTPVGTLAQMKFITQGSDPIDYTWQLDKDFAEVSGKPVRQGEYGLWGESFDGIGYVWLVGNKLYARYGSEDVSQYTAQFDGATTPPLEADNKLLVGTKDGFSFWDTHDDKRYDVKVDKDVSQVKKIAFAGDTIATLDNGTITAFAE